MKTDQAIGLLPAPIEPIQIDEKMAPRPLTSSHSWSPSMKIELHMDFESRSSLELGDVGLCRYMASPLTELLFLWYRPAVWVQSKLEYKFLDEAKCWRIWEEANDIFSDPQVPTDLDNYLQDPEVEIVAFNSAFERKGLEKVGRTLPPSRFVDPQVSGRYLSLPAKLRIQCQVLDVPDYLGKADRGEELVKLFCKKVFVKAKKKQPATEYYNDWNSHPQEWQEFLDYGRRDVVAEGELLRRCRILGAYPLPPRERELWLLDQKINDRGMPVDVEFVRKMYNLALRAKDEAKKGFEALTGVLNANSPALVKAWAHTQGYPYPSLNKDIVTSALKDSEIKLTDVCREALEMRREAASTSYQKLGAILESVLPDGRLCGQFVFMGSSRCGRWSGNIVQFHNMARPGKVGSYDFEDQKVVKEARAMVHAEDYEGIKVKYGSVLLVVKYLIRTVFVAPGNEGK